MSRFFAVFVLALSAGCVVDLQGECVEQTDCPAGTRCLDGLCLSEDVIADAGLLNDAGEETTDAGAPDAGPAPVTALIRIVTPTADALVGGADLLVEIDASASKPITSVKLSIHREGGATETFDAAASTPGRYAVSLPLGGPGYSTGAYILDASLVAADRTFTAESVRFLLDRDPPQVTLTVRYPTRPPAHLATGAFLRNETLIVDATITDAPAGPALVVPILRTPGVADIVGTRNGELFTFEIPGRAPPFPKLTGTIDAEVFATDSVGNVGTSRTTIAITRRAWSWTKPRALPVSTAPALAGDSLVFGDETGHVYAINRHSPPASGTVTGAGAWEFDVGAAPIGHATAGATHTYIVTRAGYVHALALDSNASQRRAWTCPPLTPDIAYQDGLPLTPAGGPTLMTTKVGDSTGTQRDEETVLVLTRNRTLRAYRGTRFVSSFLGQPVNGCTKELSLGIGQPITTGAPVVDLAGDIYVGTANGLIQKARFALDGQGMYEFSTIWGNRAFNTGAAIAGPLALVDAGSGRIASVLATNVDGELYAVDGSATQVWNNRRTFNEALRGGAVADGTLAAVVEQPGRGNTVDARRLSLSNGQPSGNAISLPNRSDVAEASPLIGADGRLYVASGPRLSAIAADGTVEWSFDTRPNAAGPASSYLDTVTPQLSCDGLLYVVASTTTASILDAIVTDSPGLATEGWPRAFHDPRNTGHLANPTCP